jgi:hypothetical protein
LGESFERVASLRDFVSYQENFLKYFEAKGINGNALFSALPGDEIVFDPAIEYWLQAAAPYNNCEFLVAGVVTVSGASPKLRVGNYLQLDDYTFTNDDVGRWFSLAGFATPAYNNPVMVVSVLTGHSAVIRFVAGTVTNTNETGASWTKRRLEIEPNVLGGAEPRSFPTLVRAKPWTLKRLGVAYAAGSNGETSRTDPTLTLFRDRRITVLHSTLDAALAQVTTTKSAVALLQAASDQNNTSFLGVHTTDFP